MKREGGPVTIRARIVSLLAVICLGAAACGSTVQFRSQTLTGPNGASSNPNALAGNQGLGLPTAPGSTQTSPGGTGSFLPGGSSASGGSFSGGSGFSGGTAQGVFANKILVGAVYAVNSSAANAALGAGGLTLGDPKADQQAIIDDINAHGGILGRKIVPVWHEVNGTSTETFAQLEQERCETWRSHHVFAAIDGSDETLLQCLKNAGIIPLTDGGLTEADAGWFHRYPNYVEIASIRWDRIAATQISALAAQKYFSPWNKTLGGPGSTKAKIGILATDTPAFRHTVENVMRPALRRLGYDASNSDVVYVSPLEKVSDLSGESAQVSNAVLKFNSDGVDHVQILDIQARLTLEFMREANSQHYLPRYGLNSQNGAQALLDQGLIPAEQLNGAVGFGWSPSFDVSSSQNTDNGPNSNPARRHCLKVLKARGITFSDTNSEAVALGYCNAYYFLRDALTRGGPNISMSTYLAGVNMSGSTFQPTDAFSAHFSPTQHDGVSGIRYVAYKQRCQCVEYTSNVISIR